MATHTVFQQLATKPFPSKSGPGSEAKWCESVADEMRVGCFTEHRKRQQHTLFYSIAHNRPIFSHLHGWKVILWEMRSGSMSTEWTPNAIFSAVCGSMSAFSQQSVYNQQSLRRRRLRPHVGSRKQRGKPESGHACCQGYYALEW